MTIWTILLSFAKKNMHLASLCVLGNFHAFFCHLLIFFSKLTVSENSFRKSIRVSNNSYPDHYLHSLSPDLGPNCMQWLSTDQASKEGTHLGTSSLQIVFNYDTSSLQIVFNYDTSMDFHSICSTWPTGQSISRWRSLQMEKSWVTVSIF